MTTDKSNPFAPPKANAGDLPAARTARKPMSATLFQVLLAIFAVGFLIGAVRISIVLATHFDDLQRGPAYVAFQGSWRLAAALIASGTVVAIQKASRLGRILGLLIFGAMTIAIKIDSLSDVPPQYAATQAMEGGYRLVGDVLPFVLLAWGYLFAFTAKAKAYFGRAGTAFHVET